MQGGCNVSACLLQVPLPDILIGDFAINTYAIIERFLEEEGA